MNGMRVVVMLVAAEALAGCSAARIAVPPQLAAVTQAVELTGMGFGQRGDFILGNSAGTFTRHALSATSEKPFIEDSVSSYFGDGSFSVGGADFNGRVEAQCRYLEADSDVGPATVTAIPFHYRCRFFRDGRTIDASFVLNAAPQPVGPFTAETRAGRFEIGGQVFAILPIHDSPQLAIPTAEPLGYRFVRAGQDVGAIDVNGERKTIYAPLAGPDREAVLMAGLALSVLWKN
jgi:hypothetical protein